MMRFKRRSWILLLTLIQCIFVSTSSASCTKVRDAAKKAYFGQLMFMRRGLPRATASVLFAEYLSALATKALTKGQMKKMKEEEKRAKEEEKKAKKEAEKKAKEEEKKAKEEEKKAKEEEKRAKEEEKKAKEEEKKAKEEEKKAKDEETEVVGFGDYCVDDSFLDVLQNDEGVLRTSVALEEAIVRLNSHIPLLTKKEVKELGFSDKVGKEEWKKTEKYLDGPVKRVTLATRIVFPSDGIVRVDPHQQSACSEFYKGYDSAVHGSMPAEELSATVLAVVVNLIDMGANSTKALQLLRHNTAHINLGVRCLGLDGSSLKIPTTFLGEYGRQAGVLSRNLKLPRRPETPTSVQRNAPELVQLLSSFSSGGHLPEKVIGTDGHVEGISFNWRTHREIKATFAEAAVANSQPPKTYKDGKAVSAKFATDSLRHILSAGLRRMRGMRDAERGGGGGGGGGDGGGGDGGGGSRAGPAAYEVHWARPSAAWLGAGGMAARPQQCGYGWTFQARTNVTHWHEQCGASICYTASMGLNLADAASFQEGCCAACNQYMCLSGIQAALEGAAARLTITLPAYGAGGSGPSAVLIMI